MNQSWEPKLIEALPVVLEEKDYQALLAELAEILYLQFSRQGNNSTDPTEPDSGPQPEVR